MSAWAKGTTAAWRKKLNQLPGDVNEAAGQPRKTASSSSSSSSSSPRTNLGSPSLSRPNFGRGSTLG
jgi:hypothetical protein